MKDLRDRMEPVCRAAARLAPEQGARCIMFMSARDGEGTSSVAASVALLAAQKSDRPVWLVDLGLRRNDQYRGFQKGFAKKVGKPGRAFDGSLRTLPFYSVGADAGVKSDPPKTQRLLAVHQIEGSRLLVTRFRNEALKKGQRVQLRTRPEWWQQVRRAASTVIVDAPSLSRSQAGLAMASQMDGIFIVLQADSTGADEVMALRDEIEAHGGVIAGVVMNRIGADARFADRLAG